jgi:hypothetical protein
MRHIFVFLVCIAAVATVSAQEQNVYPDGIGWVNVKERYGAKGDGVTDDTEAIRAALQNRNEPYLDRVSLYFPDGVYLVSDTLKYADGYYDCCVSIQGQSRSGTIIKLKDSCQGYGIGTSRPVLFTRNGNQSFHQNIRNITIDVGAGNPGAVAIDYIANNTGIIRDVSICAGKNSGHTGIDMTRSWPGPALVSNIVIDGFEQGIVVGGAEYSMVFENVTLTNQRNIAFTSHCASSVRNMQISGCPVPFSLSGGPNVLIDCAIEGTNDPASYVDVHGGCYIRNLRIANFASGIEIDGQLFDSHIDELLAGRRFDLWSSEGLSLRLALKETPPAYINNDMSAWASIEAYGAVASDPFFVKRVDNDAIQAAFNAGKPVVWLPITRSNGSCFGIDRPILVPQHVRLITGFDQSKFCYFDSATLVVTGDGPEPLFIERMDGVRIHHVGKRPVVLRDLVLDGYTNVAGAGEVFIENITGAFRPKHATNMWARQYNPEVQPYTEAQHENHGGKHWILGMKTEGFAELTRTTNGGATEVLGGLVYPAQSHAEDVRPVAWVVDNAHLSVIHAMRSYVSRGWYPVAVRETRGIETRELLVDSLPWPDLPLFTTGTTPSSVRTDSSADSGYIQRLTDGSIVADQRVIILSAHDVIGRQCPTTHPPVPAVITFSFDGRIYRVLR